MRSASIDADRLGRELVRDGRISEGVDAHPDPSLERTHITPEDLADADLGRMRRLVLVADHPQGHHVQGMVECAGPELEQAVLRRAQRGVALRFTDDYARAEAMLANRASNGSREYTGLERRDPQMTGKLRAPKFLVMLDEQAERSASHCITSCRPRPRAPMRKVVRDPQPSVQNRSFETVLQLQFVVSQIEDSTGLAARRMAKHTATKETISVTVTSIEILLFQFTRAALKALKP